MAGQKQQIHPWNGSAAMIPGIGAFKGKTGDNYQHLHWAHQLSIGLSNPVRIVSGQSNYNGKALFVRAGTQHKLLNGHNLSIYLDPTSHESRTICKSLNSNDPIAEPPQELVTTVEQIFQDTDNIALGLETLSNTLKDDDHSLKDNDLRAISDLLKSSFDTHQPINRQYIAKMMGLSESRFSHWFVEQTGMPLRSYKKWLRLIRGIEKILEGYSLIDAAYATDFSDQAHFTRTFVQMFGVKPSEAFTHIMVDKK